MVLKSQTFVVNSWFVCNMISNKLGITEFKRSLVGKRSLFISYTENISPASGNIIN